MVHIGAEVQPAALSHEATLRPQREVSKELAERADSAHGTDESAEVPAPIHAHGLSGHEAGLQEENYSGRDLDFTAPAPQRRG
jgi:hypothetical protein